jgi:squalene-hopene/tetraprenyl-beta-curcumene cyclase
MTAPLRLLLGLLLAAPLGPPAVAAAAANPTPAPTPLTARQDDAPEVDLKAEIDLSVRWLRGTQLPDGSYGGSVKSTAWVLQALAGSPRRYVRRDGPFVAAALDHLAARQDPDTGAIHDEGVEGFQRTEQAVLAWLALSQYDDERSNAVRARLEDYFETPLRPSPWKERGVEEARREAARLLAARAEDGSWDGIDGRIVATADAILVLAQCRKVLGSPSEGPRRSGALPPFDDADRAAALDSLRRGALFLVATSQDGLWGAPGKPDLGLTAMALGALQELPAPRPEGVQAAIDRGLAWLVEHQDERGAIHDGKLQNYLTSASILALAKSGREEYAPVIARAMTYLVTLQADEGEGYTDGDLYYGGIGYGGDERPDLSNLQMALEALDAGGLPEGDEAFRRAIRFLERTQNRSESNDVSVAEGEVTIRPGDDGGAGYAPADSKAGFEVLEDGTKVPRSYGSMTYALLKSYIFAGLPRDDPRMQAAWKWLREHYTLDVNPGFEATGDPAAPYQGLFYYFHTMAKALDLYGEELVVDGAGREHPWRRQLCGRLIAMQRRDDGSWKNENAPNWWEGNPVLATSYALLTLGAALPAE